MVAAHIRTHRPGEEGNIRVHDDRTGKVVDLDYRGTGLPEPRGRGRPSLGVSAREVTLLPRHWDWLRAQRGGASAAIRRLVEDAMVQPRTARERQDATYAFLAASCGDRPGYEEALRSLYRGDAADFSARIAGWPEDVRAYAERLLGEA